ncbi:MAG: dihydroneopterin aldolase [Alistipes sp.]|jgi:dihydroneopterin aldolase|nr:dihydroneopterin aldolase [Alistipes sp.]
MEYELRLEGMEFRAAHGCYDVEQRVGGNFTVDLRLTVEDNGGVAADNIARTVNYVEVYETVREQMAIPSAIIENTADRIMKALTERFPALRRIEITLAKLAPPLGGKAARVAVTMKNY